MTSSEIIWPTQKDENWRYTSLKKFLKTEYRPLTERSFSDAFELPKEVSTLVDSSAHLIVFYNGQWVSHLSALGEEVSVVEKATLKARAQKLGAFSVLNDRMTPSPYEVKIKKDARLQFLYLYGNLSGGETQPFVVYLRKSLKVEPKVSVEVLETHIALNNIQFHINSVTDSELGEHSQLESVLQTWLGDHAVAVFEGVSHLVTNSKLRTLAATIGGALVRHQQSVDLSGLGAEVQLDGVYLGYGDHHIDNSTAIRHLVGSTKSDQLYKGILNGRARAVFNGRLNILQDAQKSDAAQLNQTLVLSDFAEMDTKPQLEVDADDVKAAHGASVGRMSEDEMFYLQSRAISKEVAAQMLAKSFIGEVVERLSSGFLKEAVGSLLTKGLENTLKEEPQ